jgi:hypothetical protein
MQSAEFLFGKEKADGDQAQECSEIVRTDAAAFSLRQESSLA